MAADFIARDPELSRLMHSYPEPRVCGDDASDGTQQLGRVYPIFLGVPAEDVVGCVPRKYRGFQGGVREPNAKEPERRAYRFGPDEEADYKRAYREAYFGITKRKAGWDCLRHYEILAAGALPFFVPEDSSEKSTSAHAIGGAPALALAHWPKQLLASFGSLFPGVDAATRSVNATLLDADGTYARVAAGLLAYLRTRLTTTALADYVLTASGHRDARSVLILSSHPDPDYQRDLLIHGLRTRLGARAVDFVRPPHLYAPAPGSDDVAGTTANSHFKANEDLYGYGFTYAHRLRDDGAFAVDRSRIEQRIRDREFDVVIYASVHRGMPFWPAVWAAYDRTERIFVDGEDDHGWCVWSAALRWEGFYFMRELPDGCPPTLPPAQLNLSDPVHALSFHGPFFADDAVAFS